LHVFPATPHEAHRVGKFQPASRYERGIFTQTMPRNKGRLNSILREHAIRRHGGGQNRGLRVRRQLQRLLTAVEAQIGDRESQGFIRLVKHTPGHRMVTG
jgi:hypothetical protein